MPGGPLPLGLAYFAGVKLAGYTAAAYLLKRSTPPLRMHPVLFGTARTVLGLVVGVGFAVLAGKLNVHNSEAAFYLALAPVRFAEWILMLQLCFARTGLDMKQQLHYALFGTIWSYLLDIPAILAVFVVPGGAWIC